MEYRIDKYGNKLSILGFGCMRFPKQLGKIDINATEILIKEAVKKGINYFDTAYIYNDSEKILGEILKKNNLRKKVFIATKLPFIFWDSKQRAEKCLNIQLKRLKTNYIDYYLIHMLTDLDLWNKLCDNGIISWIEEKKKQGKIKQIGFSFHGSRQEFLKIIDAYPWDFCQIQYNYMNENYQAGKTGLKKSFQKKIPVIIMEPLLGGKLANKLPREALEIFREANDKISPASWALKWLWNQKEVTLLLSGMNSLEQLNDNITSSLNAKVGMLNKEETKTIESVVEIFNKSYKIFCTGCNYCMPCPKNVNIPACFSSYNTYYSIGKIEGIKQYIMSTGITSSKNGRIENCIKCGTCEKKCPQNIEIIKNLKIVEKKLEPFYIKWVLRLVQKFIKRKKKLN